MNGEKQSNQVYYRNLPMRVSERERERRREREKVREKEREKER